MKTIILFMFAALVPCLGGCATTQVLRLVDPQGDDHGPGGYRYPAHPAFSPGSFDLREFSLGRDGEDWVVEAAFAARVRRVPVFVTRDDRRELFVQTVDLYFRTAGVGGHLEALPGRGVQFAQGEQWHRAVVLSPVPAALRRALTRTSGLTDDIFVPLRVKDSGRKLRARVPAAFLGTVMPQALAVVVTGTRFSTSFEVIDRVRDQLSPEGLVMEIARSAGECRLDDPEGMGCSFSGCDPCGSHPRIIDLLAVEGEQEARLKDYSPEEGQLATVPMVPLN